MKKILWISLFLNATLFGFTSEKLSNDLKRELVEHNVWKEGCPVSMDRLRLLTIAYIDFEGKEHTDGKMLVLDAVADNALAVFKDLHEIKFPIERMELISKYDGDDDASLAANNSSAFCYREITGGGPVSLHGLGVAIDINPIQNPYLGFGGGFKGTVYSGSVSLFPPTGADYLNRTHLRRGMAEQVVEIFEKHGFTDWGGNWGDGDQGGRIDYQHFAVPRKEAEKLLKIDK